MHLQSPILVCLPQPLHWSCLSSLRTPSGLQTKAALRASGPQPGVGHRTATVAPSQPVPVEAQPSAVPGRGPCPGAPPASARASRCSAGFTLASALHLGGPSRAKVAAGSF